MPSNYTGNPTATQPPCPQPNIAADIILATPSDGDTLNASSILQDLKALADWVAFLRDLLGAQRGIQNWNSITLYSQGYVVFDIGDWHIYQATSTNSNHQPYLSPTYWHRIDWGSADLANAGATLVEAVSGAGISCSHGASVSASYQLVFAGANMSMITFVVNNVPINNYTDVDLSGSVTNFSTATFTATCSVVSGSLFNGPPVIFLNPSEGGNANVIRVNYSGNSGGVSLPSTCSVAVTMWGR